MNVGEHLLATEQGHQAEVHVYAKNDASASRLSEAKGGGPANSLQQPTPCRSLARRFAAQFSATRCVALLEPEGTARLSK